MSQPTLLKVALLGNPNSGKTTLFNRLTGSSQSTGNWPGVTVEQKKGRFSDASSGFQAEIVDLPGCYSLVASGDMPVDEQITCNYVESADNTVFVNVVDATHLHRDLYLSLQLLARGVPMIVALNCMDLATSAGIKIDVPALAQALGCPVLPIVATTGKNLQQLQQQLATGLSFRTAQHFSYSSDLDLAQQLRALISKILKQSVTHTQTKKNTSEYIDSMVLHKIMGPLIFVAVMYLMFSLAINLGGMLQLWFDQISATIFVTDLSLGLSNLGAATWLIDLLANGLGRGLNITVTFIPVLGAMFLSLGLLEGSGYMMRAAFIVDRLMRVLGLPGKSFVPMIVGFGCNVPAVMGARTLANRRERLLTILMTPFMSCSARLAIYAIFVAAFFPIGGQNVIFSLYLIGILVAVLTGLALRSTAAPGEVSISLMEMPDYRWPLWGSLFRQAWRRLRSFLLKAGALIILLSILINGFGNSTLEKFGKSITPAFAPMGISAENWPATVGLMTGLIAKEAVIGTLNSAYSKDAIVGSTIEEHLVQNFGGPIAAYAYLLFTLLYFPCVSVVAVIAKELNKKWAAFSVIWSTGLAYIIATLFYQTATWGGVMSSSSLWIIAMLALLAGFFVVARLIVGRDSSRELRYKAVPTPVSLGV